MTDKAIELLLANVNKLSGGDTEKSIELLNYAIERGWLSVFEKTEYNQPKEKQKGGSSFIGILSEYED